VQRAVLLFRRDQLDDRSEADDVLVADAPRTGALVALLDFDPPFDLEADPRVRFDALDLLPDPGGVKEERVRRGIVAGGEGDDVRLAGDRERHAADLHFAEQSVDFGPIRDLWSFLRMARLYRRIG